MLEIPESSTIAKQLNETVSGKTISYVQAGQSPHGPGGYVTRLSKKTYRKGEQWSPCPLCGNAIHKENYLGGAIYYCENCQT